MINFNSKNILTLLLKELQKLEEKENGPEADENNRKNNIINIRINDNNDFNKIMKSKMEEIKKNYMSRFENSFNRFKNCYDKHQENILKFLELKGNNLSKILNDIKNKEVLEYVENNIFNKINNIIEIFDNITSNIEDNFEVLNNLMEKNEFIKQKKPIEYFLNKNYEQISKCSLLNHFNFKHIDRSKIFINNYYKYYFDYLKEENKKDDYIETFTIKKDEMRKGLQFIKENFPLIKTMHMQGIESDDLNRIIDIILNSYKKNNNFILKKINVKDFDLSGGIDAKKLNDINFNKIQKLKFTSGKYLNSIFLKELFLNQTNCLITLSLEKINMSNIGFKALMLIFYKKPIFLKTLENLSLAGNIISVINNNLFNNEVMKESEFEKLKIFNLHKNNIYKFEMSLERFPELKLLDLSNNGILTDVLMEAFRKDKKKLVIFSDNLFITNNYNNNIKYIDYLNHQLPNLDFGVKTLHLRFTYDKEKQQLLENLKLSPSMKISLIKLDLSFCGLTTDVLTKFLKNNFGLFSLKNLKLKYNNFKSNIFQEIISDDIFLENLNVIDLSENGISCKKYEENECLVKFINKYQNLTQIKLMNAEFIDRWTVNISPDTDYEGKFRKLYKDFKDKIKEDNRKFVFIIDSDNWNFVENEFEHLFSFRSI